MSDSIDGQTIKTEDIKAPEAPVIQENQPSEDPAILKEYDGYKADRAQFVFRLWEVFAYDLFAILVQVGFQIIPGIWGIVLSVIPGLAHIVILGFVIAVLYNETSERLTLLTFARKHKLRVNLNHFPPTLSQTILLFGIILLSAALPAIGWFVHYRQPTYMCPDENGEDICQTRFWKNSWWVFGNLALPYVIYIVYQITLLFVWIEAPALWIVQKAKSWF